jgi:hypothetical protein
MAEQLFFEGRKLMAAHRYAEACATFERSEKARATIGVLLNLGDCYERIGRTASAFLQFDAAARAAAAAQDPREQYARQRVGVLEPRLVKFTIDTGRLADLPGAEVRLDGELLDRNRWGTAMAVDPGDHTIDVYALAKGQWSFRVDVQASLTVMVPQLRDAQAIPRESVVRSDTGALPFEGPPRTNSWRAQRWAGIAFGAAGLVGTGVGVAAGLVSLAAHDKATDHCFHGDDPCDPQGVRAGQAARTAGNISTVAFIVGASAIALGAALWFTARTSATRPTVAVFPCAAPGTSELCLHGTW